MMILQYFLYQRGDNAWIKLLVGYLCVSLPLSHYLPLTVLEYELGHHHLLSVLHHRSGIGILTRQTGFTSLTSSWTTLVNGCKSLPPRADVNLTHRPWLEVGWLANVPIFDGKLVPCPGRQYLTRSHGRVCCPDLLHLPRSVPTTSTLRPRTDHQRSC